MSTYYLSINDLPLAEAVTLFFLNPAVTALAAWAILREPLGLQVGQGACKAEGAGTTGLGPCGCVCAPVAHVLCIHAHKRLP